PPKRLALDAATLSSADSARARAMGNEFAGLGLHSAEYFGDTRDHWWNGDQIEFLSRFWNVTAIRSVLDVGCGIGHWGRALAPVLPRDCRLIGVDREERWVNEAARRGERAGLGDRFAYRVGTAEKLSFADESFDLVTCQTLLIHVRDPAQVLGEMV